MAMAIAQGEPERSANVGHVAEQALRSLNRGRLSPPQDAEQRESFPFGRSEGFKKGRQLQSWAVTSRRRIGSAKVQHQGRF